MADKPAEATKKADPRVEALKRNHFWILAAILLIAGFVVWWLGTSALALQFQKDKRTNDAAFLMVEPLKSKVVPNEEYTKRVSEQNSELAKGVLKAWEDLYKRQEEILKPNDKMPTELADLVLLDYNEREEAFKKNSVALQRHLGFYHNNEVIDTDFNQLFDILDLRREKVKEAPAAGAAAAAAPANADGGGPEYEGVLVWVAQNNKQSFINRYKTRLAPTVHRVAVTQEDVWIFRKIFGVIKDINQYSNENWIDHLKGEDLPKVKPRIDQANVPIKRVDYCDVAQYAMYRAFGDPGRIRSLGTENSDNAIFTGGDGGGIFTVPKEGIPEEDKILLTDRYLDSRNFPVEDYTNPPIAEFRQVFLQVQVLMDQRLVPVLISQCAKVPFPIETRQIRMSLEAVDAPRMQDAGRQDLFRVEQSPHDVLVTLRGVVYIYVKPSEKKLGKGSDKEPGKRDYGVPRRKDTPAL